MLFVFSFLSSLCLVVLTVPRIISCAYKKQIFEAPGGRKKNHRGDVPHFGGIAIYIAVLFPAVFTSTSIIERNWLLLGSLLVFGIGLLDDVKGVSPGSKLLFQFASAWLIVGKAGVQIMEIQGVLYDERLSYLAGLFVSILFIVGLVNAFNLIDGIDGLAGSIALLISTTYSFLFFQAGLIDMACISCSAVGALVAFLFFNVFSTRKIFMGDCGSLFIGLLVAYLSIKLINIPEGKLALSSIRLASKPGFVVALLSIPLFDTLRVFVLRIASGRSPFQADDNHIHHRLLSVGLSHLQATLLLLTLNLAITAFSLQQQALGNARIILLVLSILVFSNCLLTIWVNRSKKRSQAYF